jgi:hypothetical protein
MLDTLSELVLAIGPKLSKSKPDELKEPPLLSRPEQSLRSRS